jgi:AhpD family alkylhydroperoxidase
MSKRLLVHEVDPAAAAAVKGMSNYVRESGFDPQLHELVKIRASQINGCAYCLDMHNRDARAAGEDQRRLDLLAAWREAESLFSERERAALAFTEAVTLIADDGVSDEVWDAVARCFGPTEIVHLLMAISTINVYNRLAVATHRPLRGVSSSTARN